MLFEAITSFQTGRLGQPKPSGRATVWAWPLRSYSPTMNYCLQYIMQLSQSQPDQRRHVAKDDSIDPNSHVLCSFAFVATFTKRSAALSVIVIAMAPSQYNDNVWTMTSQVGAYAKFPISRFHSYANVYFVVDRTAFARYVLQAVYI